MTGATGNAPTWTTPTPPARKRRRRRFILLGAAALLVLAVALAPVIAGWIAPGYVAGAIESSLRGRATVDRVSLGWFSSQTVGPVTITDDAGDEVARLQISASRGLLGLLTGAIGITDLDLGDVRVSGRITVVRGAEGTINLLQLTRPAPPPGAAGTPKPAAADFAARLILDDLEINYTDPSSGAQAVRLRKISGAGSWLPGSPVTFTCTSEAAYGTDSGEAGVNVTILNLVGPDGAITPDKATVSASVDMRSIPTSLADAVAGANGELARELGDRISGALQIQGELLNCETRLSLASDGLSAAVDLRLDRTRGPNLVLTTSRPSTVRVRSGALAAVAPRIRTLVEERIEIDAWPEVTIGLDDLTLVFAPGAPFGLDLKASGAGITLGTEAFSGVAPALTDADSPQPFRLAPVSITFSAPTLGGPVKLLADAAARIAGESAGSLYVDVTASGLLDDSGSLRVPISFAGSVLVNGVASSLAEPFVRGTGIQVAGDFGPEVDAALRATSTAGSSPGADLDLEIRSDNVRLDAAMRLLDGVLRSTGDGLDLRVVSAGPLLNRTLAAAGITIESGGGGDITAPEFTVDLNRVATGASPDLRAVAFTSKITTNPATGRATLIAGEPARPWDLAPIIATVDAREPGRAVVTLNTNARLDGELAGVVDVDLTLAGLLDARGRFAGGIPDQFEGTASIKGVSTVLARPWLERFRLDPARDLGARFDIDLAAVARPGRLTAAPITDIDLNVRSPRITTVASLTHDGDSLRGRDTIDRPGLEVIVRAPAGIADAMFGADGRARFTGEGYFKLTATALRVPLESGSLRYERAAASFDTAFGGFALDLPAQAGRPGSAASVQIGRMNASARLAPALPVALKVDGTLTHDGRPFVMNADLALTGLFDSPAVPRPTGTLTLTDLPAALARLAPVSAELASLMEDAAGRTLTLKLASGSPESGAQRLDMTLDIESENITGRAVAAMGADRLAISRAEFNATLTPRAADSLLRLYAPNIQPPPRIVAPAAVSFAIQPLRIPMTKEAGFDWANAEDLQARIRLDGRLVATGLTIAGAEGAPRHLGPLGLERTEVNARFPLSFTATRVGTAAAAFTGRALAGAEGERLGDLEGDITLDLAGGPIASTLKLTDVNTRRLELIMERPMLITGAMGPTASVDSTLSVERAPGSQPGAYERITLTTTVASPRVETRQPIKAVVTPDSTALSAPAVFRWQMDPQWANRYVLANPERARDDPQPVARFTKASDVTLSIYRFSLGPAATPMAPGVFAVDAQVETPSINVAAANGTPSQFANFRLRSQSGGPGQAAGTLGFSLKMDAEQGGVAGAPITAEGGVYQLCDDKGQLTTDRAALTATIDAKDFPTALVDALAHRNGLLVELLGPTITLKADAAGLSKTGGKLAATAGSPRATAEIRGTVRDGAFVAETPVRMNLVEITPALGEMLVEGLPVVGRFEKRREDGPATVVVTGLRAPIGDDLRKLNGDVVLELGKVRFQTSDDLAAILREIGQREAGTLGRRVAPFRASIRDGVMTYERFTVPLGEFNIDTRGIKVDFAERTLDVVTYIPLGALTDEAAGIFNSGLGKLLGGAVPSIERATMVPWRTKGTFERHTTRPDLELFVKEFGRNLLGPGKLLEDLLKRVGG